MTGEHRRKVNVENFRTRVTYESEEVRKWESGKASRGENVGVSVFSSPMPPCAPAPR